MSSEITQNETSTNEVLISVTGVSKKFCKNFKKSLWYGLQDILNEFFGSKKERNLRTDEFWAVDDISFQLKRGECLGLIGHNGAGKSTLLKMLNGLINPDRGEIKLKGRIGALIELGAGFNPILTGRENVFNYGIVLGFTHQQILAKYRDIVEFAEMEGFMETPVQNYSSGMKVRLGFAVAAQMEPDVLIIDEVLAVGDMNFKKKCFETLQELAQKTAIIFVSHNVAHISRVSTSLIYLEKGKADDFGAEIESGIEKYLLDKPQKSKKISSVKRVDITKKEIQVLQEDIVVDLELSSNEIQSEFAIEILIRDSNDNAVAIINSAQDEKYYRFQNGVTSCQFRLQNLFTVGTFYFTIRILDPTSNRAFAVVENALIHKGKTRQFSKNARINLPVTWH